MKQKATAVMCIAALVFALCACSPGGAGAPPVEKVSSAEFKVVHITDDSLYLVSDDKPGVYTVSSDVMDMMGTGGETNAASVEAGDVLKFSYNGAFGAIAETYPYKLTVPDFCEVSGHEDDLVGFYCGVIRDLWGNDTALNFEATYMSFDLSCLDNLSAAEKEAVGYLSAVEFGCMPLWGTFDELCEQEYIDRESLYYPDGVHFSFYNTSFSEDTFEFSAEKWRGGLAAIFFADCIAYRTGADSPIGEGDTPGVVGLTGIEHGDWTYTARDFAMA